MGVMQLCTTSGWKEVGGSVAGSTSYTAVTNQNPYTVITSNAIAYTGFFGTHDITVDNGASLIINGVNKGASSTIVAGDSVAIQVTTTGPQIASTYTVKVGSISKSWSVTTRNKTPAALTITPGPTQTMNVTGPATGTGTYHSSVVTFTVKNTGETTTNTINVGLSSTTSFQLTGTNTCSGSITLAQNATCTIQVWATATGSGSLTGSTLSATATGATTGSTALSGTASGWACSLPWGGTIADGASTPAYSTSSVACGSSCPGATTRTCVDGALNNSGNYASCVVNVCPTCTLPWGGSIANGASVTAYSTNSSSNCAGSSQTRTCSNGTLSGSYQYASCSAPCNQVLCPNPYCVNACVLSGGSCGSCSGGWANSSGGWHCDPSSGSWGCFAGGSGSQTPNWSDCNGVCH